MQCPNLFVQNFDGLFHVVKHIGFWEINGWNKCLVIIVVNFINFE
jgi:hypothetical protein